MIKTFYQAAEVQARRRALGKKGRSKAVRRWVKREYGSAVEANSFISDEVRLALRGNFDGCRRFDEVYR